ncbi:hypothetical protein [Lactiplantibacillus carotarum]|uniref:hypothetical protein n=1 Tax=Lactiplantibacillus carotarum TaxID=2993456 RepID=UPI00298F1D7C|nr:hypothetical protein [Lactiplantibacillus carotarum]
MNLVLKLGAITLATITVAPLTTSTINPVIAQAKIVKKASTKKTNKTYKISKNVLKSHSKFMYSAKTFEYFGTGLSQRNAKTLRIIDSRSSDAGRQDYRIITQKVKGSTMTFKLTPKKTSDLGNWDGQVKGNGTIKLVRTGSNSYKAVVYQSGTGLTRINGRKSMFRTGEYFTPKKRTLKFKLLTKKQLLKQAPINNIAFKADYKF